MTEMELLRAIGDAEDDMLEAALSPRRTRQTAWRRLAALAACAALALGLGAYAIWESSRGRDLPLVSTAVAPGAQASMVAFVMYNGRMYVQAERLECGPEARAALVGGRLGTATGDIDEWTAQEAYARPFASNVAGEVHAVNGYDPAFRLCIPQDDGGLWLFDSLDGMALTTGAALYGEQLHLAERYVSLQYRTHENWNLGDEAAVYGTPELTEEEIGSFLAALYAAPFEYWGPDGENGDIYDRDFAQAHLYFLLDDGTTVWLRLFENGCVGYGYLPDRVYAQVTDESFRTVFAACGG